MCVSVCVHVCRHACVCVFVFIYMRCLRMYLWLQAHVIANIHAEKYQPASSYSCFTHRSGDPEAEHICGGAGDAAVFPGVAKLPAETCWPGVHRACQ